VWLLRRRGRFAGWYVQLEAPWQPFRLGFDTQDHELDIWIATDGAWQWKDEHELDVAVELGFFVPEQAAAFRAEGERVIAEWPFPTGWEEWQPDLSWPLPSLPADWDD
jgi:predicted RNA-binding protein associated with RNAse of E/G family